MSENYYRFFVGDYLLLFGAGLLGGAGHCIGMCGPLIGGFALCLRDTRATVPHLLYNLGRVTTYAAAGGVVGISGSFLRITPAPSRRSSNTSGSRWGS